VILTLSINNAEYVDDGPDYAKVELSKEVVDRITHLAEVVTTETASSITVWDYSPDFYEEDYDSDEEGKLKEWVGSVECEELVVTEDAIYWQGHHKHLSLHWDTDSISIEALKELRHIESAPLEELPLLVGTKLKSGWAEELLKERLEGKYGE